MHPFGDERFLKRGRGMGRAFLWTAAAALAMVLAADAGSKAWAERALPAYVPVSLAGSAVRLTHAHNSGIAFGWLSAGPWALLLSGAVLLALAGLALRGLRAGRVPRGAVLPLALLLGGALANFVDRLTDGHVTDFLDVGVGAFRSPVFNLADVFILAGGAALVVASRRMPAPGDAPAAASPDPGRRQASVLSPSGLEKRAMSTPYVSRLLLLALVGCTAEGKDRTVGRTASAPAASTEAGRTPSHREQEVRGGGMIHQVRAHTQAMQAAGGEAARARLPAHADLVETMLAQMSREMARGNTRSDAAWNAIADSVRRDLEAMSRMGAGELERSLPEHGRRLDRLMDLHQMASDSSE